MNTKTVSNSINHRLANFRIRLRAGIAAIAALLLTPILGHAASPDGLIWTSQASGTTQPLHSVSVLNKGFVVATGHDATVLRYDGSAWAPFSGFADFASSDTGWNDAKEIRSSVVVGSSAVYVGSYDAGNGKVAYWNGSEWANISTGTGLRVVSLYAADSDNVLAGRISGYIARFDDGAFGSHVLSGQEGNFTVWKIAGSGTDNIWATGPNGSVLHSINSGTTWTSVSTGPSFTGAIVPQFSLSATQNWFRAGNDLLFYDGTDFSLLNTFGSQINGVYALSENQVWVVGNSGLASYYNGIEWQNLDLGSADWRGISGVGSDIWVVGGNGQIHAATIPEPSSALLFLTSGLLLILKRRRKSRISAI